MRIFISRTVCRHIDSEQKVPVSGNETAKTCPARVTGKPRRDMTPRCCGIEESKSPGPVGKCRAKKKTGRVIRARSLGGRKRQNGRKRLADPDYWKTVTSPVGGDVRPRDHDDDDDDGGTV